MAGELKERSSSRTQIFLNSLGLSPDGAVGEDVVLHGVELRAAATKGDCAGLRRLLCSSSSSAEPLAHDLSDEALQAALEQKDKLGNVRLPACVCSSQLTRSRLHCPSCAKEAGWMRWLYCWMPRLIQTLRYGIEPPPSTHVSLLLTNCRTSMEW